MSGGVLGYSIHDLSQLDERGCANALNTSIEHGLTHHQLMRKGATTTATTSSTSQFRWRQWCTRVLSWTVVLEWMLLLSIVILCAIILSNTEATIPQEYSICTLCVAVFMGLFKLYYAGSAYYYEFYLGSNQCLDARVLTHNVCVRRRGQTELVAIRELHVGDVIVCVRGQVVPADCRVVRSDHCFVSEFALTAREEWVAKASIKQTAEDLTRSVLPRNMIYAGSCVMMGRCEGIVLRLAQDVRGTADRSVREEQRIAQLGRSSDESVDTSVPTELQALQMYVWITGVVVTLSIVAFDFFLATSSSSDSDHDLTYVFAACALLIAIAPSHFVTTHTFALVHALRQAQAHGIVLRRGTRTLDALARVDLVLVQEEELLTEGNAWRAEVASASSSKQMKIIALPGYSLRGNKVKQASMTPGGRQRHFSASDTKSSSGLRSPQHNNTRHRRAPSDTGSTQSHLHFPRSDAQAQCLLALFEQVIGSSPFLTEKLHPSASSPTDSPSRSPSPSSPTDSIGALPSLAKLEAMGRKQHLRRDNDSIFVAHNRSSSSASRGLLSPSHNSVIPRTQVGVESVDDEEAVVCDDVDTAVLQLAFRISQMNTEDADNFHHILTLAAEVLSETKVMSVEPCVAMASPSSSSRGKKHRGGRYEEGRAMTVTREAPHGEDASAALLESATNTDTASIMSGMSDTGLNPPPYRQPKPIAATEKKESDKANGPILISSFRGDPHRVLDCCTRMVVPVQALEQKENTTLTSLQGDQGDEQHVHGFVKHVKMTPRIRLEMKRLAAHLSGMGLRVVAFGKRAGEDGEGVFCGFLGFTNPACLDVSAALKELLQADVPVHILSTDAQEFAVAIGEKGGLAGQADREPWEDREEKLQSPRVSSNEPATTTTATTTMPAIGINASIQEETASSPWSERRIFGQLNMHETGEFIRTSKHAGHVVCYCSSSNHSVPVLNEADVSVSIGLDAHAIRANADVVLRSTSELQVALALGREYKQMVVCTSALELAHRVNLVLLCIWSAVSGYGFAVSGGCLLVVECIRFAFHQKHITAPGALEQQAKTTEQQQPHHQSMLLSQVTTITPNKVSFFSRSFLWAVVKAILFQQLFTLPVFVTGFHLQHFQAWPDSGFDANSVQSMTFVAIMLHMLCARRVLMGRHVKMSWGHVLLGLVVLIELVCLVSDPNVGPLVAMVTLSEQGGWIDHDTPVLGLMSVPVLVAFTWPLLCFGCIFLVHWIHERCLQRTKEKKKLVALTDYQPLEDF